MSRPVDKSQSTDVAKALAMIDKIAARQTKAARAEYAAGVRQAKAEYVVKERALRSVETEKIKRIERTRISAVARVEGFAPSLADYRSVKRESIVKASNGVSLPRLSCLEGQS